MTDSSLVRVLARQTRHKVGLVPLKQVQAGSATLRAALDKLAVDSVRHVIVDAVADTDLGIIGEAVGDDLLVTGGSGVALGLPAAYRRRDLLAHKSGVDALPGLAARPRCLRDRALPRHWARSRPSRARTSHSIPTPSAAANR